MPRIASVNGPLLLNIDTNDKNNVNIKFASIKVMFERISELLLHY